MHEVNIFGFYAHVPPWGGDPSQVMQLVELELEHTRMCYRAHAVFLKPCRDTLVLTKNIYV
jgi:hypothetical protein